MGLMDLLFRDENKNHDNSTQNLSESIESLAGFASHRARARGDSSQVTSPSSRKETANERFPSHNVRCWLSELYETLGVRFSAAKWSVAQARY